MGRFVEHIAPQSVEGTDSIRLQIWTNMKSHNFDCFYLQGLILKSLEMVLNH